MSDINNGSLAVIYSGDRFLLQKRTKDAPSYPLYWSLPGGHLSKKETKEKALIRELYEELGIKFDINEFNYIGEFKRVEKKGKLFLWEHYGDYILNDFKKNEAEELRLIKKDNLKHLKLTPDMDNLFKILPSKNMYLSNYE